MQPRPSRSIPLLLLRTAALWTINAAALWLAGLILPGISITNWTAAFLFVVAVGALDTLLWPLLARLTLRFVVFTLGFFTFLLNGLIFWFGGQLVDGVEFGSLGSAVLAALFTGVFSTAAASLFAIDDNAAFYRNVVERNLRRVGRERPAAAYPGVLLLEIDGLSEASLRRALDAGVMPVLAAWQQAGSHRIVGWETDLSCQTGAAQAGILHGNNADIPAFRWVEKENGNRVVSSNGPKDSVRIEQRISDGHGLLAGGSGASRANLFSGDADDDLMVYSTLTSPGKFYKPSYYVFFANPYNFMRTLTLMVVEVVHEMRQRRRQIKQDIQPRVPEHRRGLYPLVRAAATVFLRDMALYTLIGDVARGRADAIYATFYGYDVVGHYSGVEDADSLAVLRQLDRAIGRIEGAVREARRPYQIVVLSDHGQSKGATFRQRYGATLKDVVTALLPAAIKTHHELDTHEGWGHVGALVTEAVSSTGQAEGHVVGKALRELTRRRTRDGEVLVGPDYQLERDEQEGKHVAAEDAELIVLASGNLGLIYFTDWRERMTLEQLDAAFPHLIPGLVTHPGIGFVMVRSQQWGPLAIGPRGVNYLAAGRIEGEDPLAVFSAHLPAHLCRTDSFAHAPDILVNSFYDPQKDEGAAFEELIGFHGGAGGCQSYPFLLVPSDWQIDAGGPIVGAEAVYRVLKQQIERVRG
jgi:putative membrane protein